ncbi:DegV family protein [Tersicoccus solisilvae]|uniref:DegV family protein n=1 Tax=Tersicoccus solisilvae TaxID=1882339 RepID=UPI00166DA194|nr:DegV family protein [Tersicoccus solisilvae]
MAVVTDAAAGLPDDLRASLETEHGLIVLDLPVTVDGVPLPPGPPTALELALASGRPVATSRPSPGAVEAVYRRLAEAGHDHIVSIHLSSGLSGTVDSARWAAGRVPVPVSVIDSGTAGMALGYAVRDACAAAAAGATPGAVAAAARRTSERHRVRFYVPSLETLRRGGRVGGAAAWIGGVLAIKPLLQIADGVVVPVERIRAAARAVRRLEALAAADLAAAPPSAGRECAVHHFGNVAEAEELAERLTELTGVRPVVSRLPSVLAAHVGLGVLGVVTGPAASPSPGPPDRD